MDYEVVWDGAHRDVDADLLRPDLREPRKRLGSPKVAEYGSVIAAVWASLPWTQANAVNLRDLVTSTGCLPQAVNSALHQLRLRGDLASEIIPGLAMRVSRPPQRYWRRAK